MQAPTNSQYDVLIMGGGFAGNVQARPLLRKIPGIRIAMVEPRSDEEIASIHKIGESTVEIAANFLARELGLVDYLIEHHPPKCGLNFHWPKKAGQTKTVEDYHSVWSVRFPKIGAFQLHRGKLERDLMEMNRADGVHTIQGLVKDFDIVEGEADHRIEVEVDGEVREVSATHLVDAASRKFLTGRKTKNMLVGPKNLFGLDTGAAWVRVSGVDRKIFRDGMDPMRSSTSNYYCTNHWFGHGHWLWMIPICRDSMSLSIGIVCHNEVLPGKTVASQEKFLAFLKANHEVLYDLVKSGNVEDFVYWTRPSHRCHQMFSKDNWYAIGDAAYFGDAFYSLGTSTIALAVESVTEIIRAKRAGDADAEEKRAAYDGFNSWYGGTVVHLYRDHHKHLGHAGAMSWRIYFEYMWWFGAWVPMYLGKWHLDPEYCRGLLRHCERHFFKDFYDDLTRVVDEGRNIGWMDSYRADQLAFGYYPPQEHGEYLEDTIYEPQKLNIYHSVSRTYLYSAVFWMKFQWKAFGVLGVLRPKTLYHLVRLLKQAAWVGLGSLRHRLKMGGEDSSTSFRQVQDEMADYAYKPSLQPWLGEDGMPLPGLNGVEAGMATPANTVGVGAVSSDVLAGGAPPTAPVSSSAP